MTTLCCSLLKVHLQLRGFSVFLDIDRLRAGKFDENLLMNIKLAKHFLLVLTTNALDRCINDIDRADWVHKVGAKFLYFGIGKNDIKVNTCPPT